MLRILQRNPDRIPMERLGEYIRLFAELLGTDNHPVFAGIKKASTGLKAAIPHDRRPYAQARLIEAKSEPTSKPARLLRGISQESTRGNPPTLPSQTSPDTAQQPLCDRPSSTYKAVVDGQPSQHSLYIQTATQVLAPAA
jgi:hypothetical protein